MFEGGPKLLSCRLVIGRFTSSSIQELRFDREAFFSCVVALAASDDVVESSRRTGISMIARVLELYRPGSTLKNVRLGNSFEARGRSVVTEAQMIPR